MGTSIKIIVEEENGNGNVVTTTHTVPHAGMLAFNVEPWPIPEVLLPADRFLPAQPPVKVTVTFDALPAPDAWYALIRWESDERVLMPRDVVLDLLHFYEAIERRDVVEIEVGKHGPTQAFIEAARDATTPR